MISMAYEPLQGAICRGPIRGPLNGPLSGAPLGPLLGAPGILCGGPGGGGGLRSRSRDSSRN